MAKNIIPTDSPSIFDVIDMLSTLDRQAIIRTNNPPPGVAGFIFQILGDETFEVSSEITDHFIEDNTTVQDQIALKPEQYTLHGIIAELTDAGATPNALQQVPQTLPVNDQLEPEIPPEANQIYRESITTSAQQDQAITNSPTLYNYFLNNGGSRPSQTLQTSAAMYFYQLWKGRQIFTVETAWGILTDMAISSFRVDQPEETNQKSEFTIVVKKMRFVDQITINPGQLAGRASPQQAPVTQNGNAGQAQVSDAQKESLFHAMVAGIAQQ